MKINTKSVFEWDGSKYIEVENESYDYNGPLALAITDKYGGGQQSSSVPVVPNSLADLYGVGLGKFSDEEDLFTKIDKGNKDA